MGNGIISGTKSLAPDEHPDDAMTALAARLCAQSDRTIRADSWLRRSLVVEYDEKRHEVSGRITFFDAFPDCTATPTALEMTIQDRE